MLCVFFLVLLCQCLTLATARPSSPLLRGCAPKISPNGTNHWLTRTETLEQSVECEYVAYNIGGGTTSIFCFYDSSDFLLKAYLGVRDGPNVRGSNPYCPITLPSAGKYLIKPSVLGQGQSGQCLTLSSDANGAEVITTNCDGRHGYPNQLWNFLGSTMRQGNKCVDVKDGKIANGVQLQTWDCLDGAATQQFIHLGGTVITLPKDIVRWMAHPGMCMDLTDGANVEGTEIQLWACSANNSNQVWKLQAIE